MNKEALFVYEEDGFCELKYTYKDLRKLEQENQQLRNSSKEILYTFAKKDRVLKELKNWLEEMLDNENDIFSVVRVKDVLSKLNELEKEGKNNEL